MGKHNSGSTKEKSFQRCNGVKGIGVDLIALDRAKVFLKRHGTTRVRRVLGNQEKKDLKGREITALQFAKQFAAKEAFFKASGKSWMGVDGFSKMNVTFLKGNRFRVQTASSSGEGCFFRARKWVGAQVILWQDQRPKTDNRKQKLEDRHKMTETR